MGEIGEFRDPPETDMSRLLDSRDEWRRRAERAEAALRAHADKPAVRFEVTPDEMSTLADTFGNVGRHELRLATRLLNVALSKRPAAAPVEWTPELAKRFAAALCREDMARTAYEWGVSEFGKHAPVAGAVDGVIVNGVQRDRQTAFKEQQQAHADACKRYAEQIKNLEKRAHKAEDQAGKARCERDKALERITKLRSDVDAFLAQVGYDNLADVELDFLEWASTKQRAEAAEAEVSRLKQELAEHRECVALARCEPNPPHEPIMSFEEWLSEMAEQGPDELLSNWPRQAKMALQAANDEYASLRDEREAAEKRAAELERERDEARAKLEALREWAERAIRVDTSEGYVFAARDVTNLIEPQPGELLLSESPRFIPPKPAKPAKPADPVAELEGRVRRCEAAIRKLCSDGGILVAGRAEALAALEGKS